MNKISKFALGLGLALTLAGCGNQAGANNQGADQAANNANNKAATNNTQTIENKEDPAQTAPDTNAEATAKEAYVDEAGYPTSLDQAVDAFKKQFPSAKLTEVAFEKEAGRYVYDLEGEDEAKDYDLKLDATTGEVLKQKEDADKNQTIEELNLDGIKPVNEAIEAAKKAANKNVKGVKEWALDQEMDKAVYSIDLELDGGDLEIALDAKTLEVLELDD